MVAAACGGALVAYLRAVGRRQGGRAAVPASWRQGAFVAGMLSVAGGIMLPDTAFSRHVVGHLLLAVVGPTLVVLGAPVAVASAASPRARRLVAGLRRRRLARAVTQPPAIWLLFNGGLLALYLTPLYRWSLRNPLVHEAVHGHMLVTGLLFAELAVGAGPPLPSRPGFPARVAAVAFSLPVHALLGLAVLSLPGPSLQPAGMAGGLADQRAGGWLLWVAGDLVLSNLLVGVLVAWGADEERRERVAGFASAHLGKATSMSETPLRDSDITRDEPTEDDQNLDTGGEGPRDTGDQPTEDQPTEDDQNLDTGGEGPRDTGDASSESGSMGRSMPEPPPSGGEDYRLIEDGPGPAGNEPLVPGADPADVETDDAYLDNLDGSGGGPDLVNPVDPAQANR